MDDTIYDVKNRHEQDLMSFPNVVGIGVGYREGREVIRVLVRQKIAKDELKPGEIIPRQIEGFDTDIEEIGNISTQVPFRGSAWILSIALAIFLRKAQL